MVVLLQQGVVYIGVYIRARGAGYGDGRSTAHTYIAVNIYMHITCRIYRIGLLELNFELILRIKGGFVVLCLPRVTVSKSALK